MVCRSADISPKLPDITGHDQGHFRSLTRVIGVIPHAPQGALLAFHGEERLLDRHGLR
jgi:hypothetical protein